MARLIREVHILEAHGGVPAVIQGLAFHIFALLVQYGKHAFRACDGRLELAIDLRDLVDRAAELLGIDDERGDHAHGNQPVNREITSEGCDDDKSHVADAIHDRSHDATEDVRPDARLRERIGCLAE